MLIIGAGHRAPQNRGINPRGLLAGGLWQQNAFQATLYFNQNPGSGYLPNPFVQDPNDAIECLIFTQDYPIITHTWAYWPSFRTTDSAGNTTDWGAGQTNDLGAFVGWDMTDFANCFSPAAGQPVELPPGQSIVAETDTHGVLVRGYPVLTGVNAFPERTNLGAAGIVLRMTALAESGVVHGFGAPSLSAGAVDPRNVLNIILREDDYTQAIFDAGNTIAANLLGLGQSTLNVVGIWAQGAT